MENLQSQNQSKEKYELKDYIETNEVKSVLQKWLSALDGGEDLVVNVKGKDCTIPKAAFEKAKVKIEYEIKNGEYEFELEMKWRDSEGSAPLNQ